MGSITGPTFSGQSSYAADLQSALNRAIQIASLPIQLMQQTVGGLQSQQQALSMLQASFGALQSSLSGIGSATGGTLQATVSDSDLISATAASTTLPGTYSIQVIQVGTSTQALSSDGLPVVTDPASTTNPLSSSTSFTLTANGQTYTLTPADTSLNSLAAAINSSGAAVQATIVNVGGDAAPDYRLSISSTEVGSNAIQLNDGTTDLMTTLSTGVPSQYSVGGSSNVIETDSNQITLAPGLTVNLLQASDSPVTITVGANYNSLSNDLASFAQAYNSALSSLNQQIGQNAGPLAGQSIIYTLSNTLSSLLNYSATSGTVKSLANLGLTLNEDGTVTFDSTQFNSQNINDIKTFLGGATTGGFLQMATAALTTAADPTTGALQTQYNTLQNEVTNENNLISNQEIRLTDLQTNLILQLSQADAVIANLEAQKSYYTQLFQAQYPSSSATG